MDLLRACQREGTVRLERDRRGGLRVFQGASFVRGVVPPVEPGQAVVVESGNGNVAAAEVASSGEETESDLVESAPVEVVDTTAELLGRAKPKRARTRAAGPAHATGSSSSRVGRRSGRPAAAGPSVKRSAGAPRRSRSKKATTDASDDSDA